MYKAFTFEKLWPVVVKMLALMAFLWTLTKREKETITLDRLVTRTDPGILGEWHLVLALRELREENTE